MAVIGSQTELPMQLERKKPAMMDLLQIAIQNNSAIDVIERLAALQRESLAREAEIEFNEALNRVQREIRRIAPDLDNSQTKSRYASYAAIDRVVRPLYSQEGLSLSFSTEESNREETVRVVCFVSRGGHTRKYQVDMPADGKGAKGGDVMTKTHATGAAMAYGMRYLLKGIFNIAIGAEDDDGNLTNGEVAEQLEWIANCRTPEELKKVFAQAWNRFENGHPAALKAIVAANKKRREELK